MESKYYFSSVGRAKQRGYSRMQRYYKFHRRSMRLFVCFFFSFFSLFSSLHALLRESSHRWLGLRHRSRVSRRIERLRHFFFVCSFFLSIIDRSAASAEKNNACPGSVIPDLSPLESQRPLLVILRIYLLSKKLTRVSLRVRAHRRTVRTVNHHTKKDPSFDIRVPRLSGTGARFVAGADFNTYYESFLFIENRDTVHDQIMVHIRRSLR